MKRLLLLSLTIRVTMAFAQLTPIYNVPSPEIANLGTYGTIPVSHFTGIPDISIPLYDVKVGNYTLPLTARYHIASVKPHAQPGPLGLGWSLDAGGYITRTVRFIYDEKQNENGHPYGFYGHANDMQYIQDATDYQNMIDLNMNLHQYEIDSYYELSPDEFSFNFCGYSGNFYYNEFGGWTVVSDDDIKVEFDPQTGFLTWQQLNQRFHEQGWLNSTKNNRFFNKFTLVTPDGSRYEFGGLYATEYSIDYYARNSSDLIPTTWRLTKITTPDKHEITLSYMAEELLCDLRYVPTEMSSSNYAYRYNGSTPVYKVVNTGRNAFKGYLIFPVELIRIETKNEFLDFTYDDDISYRTHFLNTEAVYWEDNMNTPYKFDTYYWMFDSPSAQFNVFVNAPYSQNDSPNTKRNYIISKFKSDLLHRISISKTSGNECHNIYFRQTLINRRKLTDIIFRDGFYELQREQIFNLGYMIMGNYIIPDNHSSYDMPEYHFTYNTDTMPSRYAFAKTDSWGYFYGGIISMSNAFPSFAIRTPNTIKTKAQTLTEIQYPTGGRTVFEYEQNRYHKKISEDNPTVLENSVGSSGGLRISKITTFDRDSQVVNCKEYEYNNSGVLRRYPHSSVVINLGNNRTFTMKSDDSFFPNATNINSPDIGYSFVTEKHFDQNYHEQGSICHYYSNYDTQTANQTFWDESPLYHVHLNSGGETSSLIPYTSNSAKRGKLLCKQFYDSEDLLVKSISYTLKSTENSPIRSPLQYSLCYARDEYNNPIITTIGWMPQTYTYSYLPIKVSVSEYGENDEIITEHSYAYNNHKMLSSDSLLCSDGTMSVTSYSYSYDYNTPPYTWMATNHYLQPVVSKVNTCGGKTRTTISNYALSSNNVPYLQKAQTAYGSTIRDEYEVITADQYGNPVEIMQDSIHTVLVWGHYGQLLVAKIVNTTISQLATIANINPVDVSTLSRNYIPYTALANAKQSLPGSMFDIYKYTSSLQLRSHEAPNGYTTYYAYDESGRLRKTGYVDEKVFPVKAKILNQYDYRFYHNNRNLE